LTTLLKKVSLVTVMNKDLDQRVKSLRDEFSAILDSGEVLEGELRIKLAKAELVLNKIYRLLNQGSTQ